jgi:hypothetical protein
VDRQNLAGLDAGDWTIDAEAQLDGGNAAIENGGLLASSIRRTCGVGQRRFWISLCFFS